MLLIVSQTGPAWQSISPFRITAVLCSVHPSQQDARSSMATTSRTRLPRMALCVALSAACVAGAQTSTIPQQITQQEQKLAAARAAKDHKNEAQQLIALATLYSKAGKRDKALDYDNQALAIARQRKLRSIEATALNDIGGVYSDIGQQQKALEYLNQSLPIQREVKDRKGEADTLD